MQAWNHIGTSKADNHTDEQAQVEAYRQRTPTLQPQTKSHTNNTQIQKRRTSRPSYHKPDSIFIKFPNLKAQKITRIHSAITEADKQKQDKGK